MSQRRAKTPIERHYAFLMRMIGLTYLATAVLFFVFPNEIFYLLNVGPKLFKVLHVIPEASESFFGTHAVSLWVVLAALAFLAAESPRVSSYPILILLALGTSMASFMYLLLYRGETYFAYAIALLFHGIVALMILWGSLRVAVSRPTEKTSEKSPAVPHLEERSPNL